MWKNKVFRAALISVLARFAQVILGMLVIGPFITGRYNVVAFVIGIVLIVLCVGGLAILSLKIKEA